MKRQLLAFLLASTLALNFTGCAPSTPNKFVRVAVVKAETVEHIRSLFKEAGIKITADKILVPDGSFHAFPPNTYTISVLEGTQERALSLIRADAPKSKYWIQAGPVLDTLYPPHADLKPAGTKP